jgi:IS5 family transposase
MCDSKLRPRIGTAVDATLIAAPSSTKNAEGKRDPQMHQTRKAKQWYFGMKANIGVDAQSGLVHTVVGTAANVSDINVAGVLLHGQEPTAVGDAGYRGEHKRAEKMKASIRAKVEHPLRVIKQQFGFTMVRYRGLAKNTAQVVTLFALSNLRMARRRLIGIAG